MGNCMASIDHGVKKEAMVDVLREEDYEFLEYKSPVRVSDVLLDNPGCHIVVDSEGQEALPGEHEMRAGVSYILIKNNKRKIEDGKVEKDEVEPREKGAGLRVRVVLTKKELAQLLSKCGGELSSLEDVMGKLKSVSVSLSQEESPLSSERWKPMLDTIPEDF